MARDDLERGSPQGTAVSTSTSAGDTRTGTGALPGAEKQKSSDNFIFSLRDWVVERFNWSWFTYAQPTGGIGIVLAQCPKQFYGLQTIGTIVFIFNIVLFLIFTALLALRWVSKPSTVRRCFTQARNATSLARFG